jgi:hypothetical protein
MLTKKQFAELLLAAPAGGDNVAPKITMPEAYHYIDMGIASLLGQEYTEKYWNTDEKSINGNWITTLIPLPVKHDAIRNSYYIQLPVQLIALEENRGLQVVCKAGDESNPVYIIGHEAVGVIRNLECGMYPDVQYCYPEGANIIRFMDLPPLDAAAPYMVKLVCSTSGLPEDRVIPVSGAMEAQLFKLTMELMSTENAARQKKTNDGNPNTI